MRHSQLLARRRQRLRYRSDMRIFSIWAKSRGLNPIPAQPETVAGILASKADAGVAVATVARRLAAPAEQREVADLGAEERLRAVANQRAELIAVRSGEHQGQPAARLAHGQCITGGLERVHRVDAVVGRDRMLRFVDHQTGEPARAFDEFAERVGQGRAGRLTDGIEIDRKAPGAEIFLIRVARMSLLPVLSTARNAALIASAIRRLGSADLSAQRST